MNNTKKVILFVVEGPTDQETLSPIIKKLYPNNIIIFRVIHGDVTTQCSHSKADALNNMSKHISKEMKKYGLRSQDIEKIAHISDMDGAFINKKYIIEADVYKTQYHEDRIESKNPPSIMGRNRAKSRTLNYLINIDTILDIPYKVYYFSRNLEHTFHNQIKYVTDHQKSDLAFDFAEKFIDNPNAFLDYISNSDFSVKKEYNSSWEFIQKDLNSLNRYTNFNLFFE